MSSNGSQAKLIPTRRVELTDNSQLPVDYSTTPGGTWFSTTPGGTRVIYDRSRLLIMRNSPLSRTPPANLPKIPGVTVAGDASQSLSVGSPTQRQTISEEGESNGQEAETSKDEDQFPMDI